MDIESNTLVGIFTVYYLYYYMQQLKKSIFNLFSSNFLFDKNCEITV